MRLNKNKSHENWDFKKKHIAHYKPQVNAAIH